MRLDLVSWLVIKNVGLVAKWLNEPQYGIV